MCKDNKDISQFYNVPESYIQGLEHGFENWAFDSCEYSVQDNGDELAYAAGFVLGQEIATHYGLTKRNED